MEEYQTAPEMNYTSGSERASIIEKINPDEIVELLRMRLMGRMQDSQTGEWVVNKHLQSTSITEVGAWDISNLLLSISNANTSLSKLDDKTIRKRALIIMEASIKKMISHWDEYGITNTAQLRYIAEIVFSITLITLKMADAEGIRKMITHMYSESKNISHVGTTKSKKLFGRNVNLE